LEDEYVPADGREANRNGRYRKYNMEYFKEIHYHHYCLALA
jgi:hypothetical protein